VAALTVGPTFGIDLIVLALPGIHLAPACQTQAAAPNACLRRAALLPAGFSRPAVVSAAAADRWDAQAGSGSTTPSAPLELFERSSKQPSLRPTRFSPALFHHLAWLRPRGSRRSIAG
jgi:hypothetical protein